MGNPEIRIDREPTPPQPQPRKVNALWTVCKLRQFGVKLPQPDVIRGAQRGILTLWRSARREHPLRASLTDPSGYPALANIAQRQRGDDE